MAAFIPLIAGGISALSGAFSKPQTNKTTGTTEGLQQTTGSSNSYSASDINSFLQTLSELTNQSQTSGTTSTAANLSPQAQAFLDTLIRRNTSLAGAAPNLAPYQAQQTQQNNQRAQLQQQAVDNIMASRGLSGSPAAGTSAARVDAQRVAANSGIAAQIPLLQHQLNLQNLQQAGSFFGQIPRGTSTTNAQNTLANQYGNTTQQGKTTGVQTNDTNTQQNTATHGNYSQEGNQNTGGGLGGFLGGLGPILAALFPKGGGGLGADPSGGY